jgi:hypothetical protein
MNRKKNGVSRSGFSQELDYSSCKFLPGIPLLCALLTVDRNSHSLHFSQTSYRISEKYFTSVRNTLSHNATYLENSAPEVAITRGLFMM